METIYRDRANGRDEYFVYSDACPVRVTAEFAAQEERRELARIVSLSDELRKIPGAEFTYRPGVTIKL